MLHYSLSNIWFFYCSQHALTTSIFTVRSRIAVLWDEIIIRLMGAAKNPSFYLLHNQSCCNKSYGSASGNMVQAPWHRTLSTSGWGSE